MAWQKIWRGKRKKAEPNSRQQKPTISFRANMAPEILGHLKALSTTKEKSDFINRAIGMRYFYITNKKKFIEEMIRDNFQLVKHLLRREGSSRNRRYDVTN